MRRLRTLTFGLLTPFLFHPRRLFRIVPRRWLAASGILCLLLGAKMVTKFVGVYPITKVFTAPHTGGHVHDPADVDWLNLRQHLRALRLAHGIVDQKQYSYLIAAVIGSAIVPTLIANAFFLPHHLLRPTSPRIPWRSRLGGKRHTAKMPSTGDPCSRKFCSPTMAPGRRLRPSIAAWSMAKCFAAELSIVVVIRPPEFAEDVETEAVIENARAHYPETELASCVPGRRRQRRPTPDHIRVGHPAEQIIAAAEEWGADLIVTGHRGRGLFERWLLGSVSRVVIAYARCAVLVVR